MKNILILTIVAIILLIVVIIICLRFQKGDSELLNSKNKNVDTQKNCNSCRQPIHASATVCQHCGQQQGLWRKYFRDITIIVSIVMVILAIAQFLNARQKNVDASVAKETAEKAAIDADLALTQVQSDANEVKNLKSEANKLNRLLEKSSKLTSEIVEIQHKSILINEFMMTLISAQNHDRQAYDQLSAFENDNQSPFQQHAMIAKMSIRLQYGEKIGSVRGISTIAPTWKEGVDPSIFTISKLIDDHNKTAWYFRPGLTAYIWERDDFSKKDRIHFLIDVLKNDRNLKAVCLAQYFLSKEANIKFNPLIIEPLLEWWEKNKGIYNKNPE